MSLNDYKEYFPDGQYGTIEAIRTEEIERAISEYIKHLSAIYGPNSMKSSGHYTKIKKIFGEGLVDV